MFAGQLQEESLCHCTVFIMLQKWGKARDKLWFKYWTPYMLKKRVTRVIATWSLAELVTNTVMHGERKRSIITQWEKLGVYESRASHSALYKREKLGVIIETLALKTFPAHTQPSAAAMTALSASAIVRNLRKDDANDSTPVFDINPCFGIISTPWF